MHASCLAALDVTLNAMSYATARWGNLEVRYQPSDFSEEDVLNAIVSVEQAYPGITDCLPTDVFVGLFELMTRIAQL